MNRETKYFYNFGPFRFDTQERQLVRGDEPLSLPPKAIDVLAVLVENAGHLVHKEKLIRQVWPDAFVEEGNLNKNISVLRKTLGQWDGGREYIETVPKRGYRFVATVNQEAKEQKIVPAQASTVVMEVPAPRPTPWLPKPTLGILLILIVATAAAWLLVWHRRELLVSPDAPAIHSLGVLPLENLSGDPAQDYFADGMTDELITHLGQIASLRVISRTSVMQYRGAHKLLPQIARELKVDAIVEGTVMRSGQQVRITAQLIQAASDKHLWAQSYQRDSKDVLGLQQEIASAIAKQIRMTLTPGEQIRAGIGQPVNVEAYESYWRGEYFLNRFTPDSIRKAADYFQQAIDKDPNYPAAYTKLAACYQILGRIEANYPMVTKTNSLIAKALELDPQFASAHAVRGWNLIDYDFDLAAAGSEFQRAVELNPNGADGYLGLSEYYAAMGRMQESLQEVQRARDLDPLDLIVNTHLCTTLYRARRFDEALAQCKANLDLDPSSLFPHRQLGLIYAAKGLDSEAAAAFIRSEELGGASLAMIAALQAGERDSGLPGFWTAWLQFQRASITAGKEDPMKVAAAYSFARDTDRALQWLEMAFKARRPNIIFLGVDPTFDRLRSDPRFVALLKRIGSPTGQS